MVKTDRDERSIDTIRIIGTGHVLEKSVREVEEVIAHEKPDVVAVELCDVRYRALKGELEAFSPKELLSAGNPFLLLTHWLLAYVQRKMGKELGIEPGADMMAAIKKAEELGCEVALIDRPIHITMQRFWKKMRFVEKLKMIFSIIFSIASIGANGTEEEEEKGGEEEAKEGTGKKKTLKIGGTGRAHDGAEPHMIELDRITDDDVVTQLMRELREFSPGAATALLDERDAYIARSLLDLQTRRLEQFDQQPFNAAYASAGAKKIVAVVGAGHVAGIKQYLSHPELIPSKDELCALPRKRFGLTLKNLLGVGLGVAFLLILLAIMLTDISVQLLLRALFWWFIINGVLSAAGVVMARGHPLSAFTAFAVAWLTSLNPFLAAGWFAGLMEAHLRRPSIEDAKNMLNVDSLRDLLKNRLFKVILVAALANLGSMAGTFIGLYVVGHVLGVDIYGLWTGLKSIF
ncbi:MAG: TraB/GumN family protein [Methanophagales archaeon ANME-1-THS]|nr:MAG: TraB/GumN family protein [Methanophagales archaeon ANME-1-THS]